jgi:outer membrane immunogenic protein
MLKAMAIAALVLTPLPSFAADLMVPQAPMAVAPVASSFDWTGGFVGAYVGGAWVHDIYNPGLGPDQTFNQAGYTIGAKAGYNAQVGSNFVLGLEIDGGWVSASSTDTINPGPGPTKTSLNWDGHLLGRAGVSMDNALFYLTGGGAVGNFTQDASPNFPAITNTVYGYAIGAGIEYALNDNWVLGAEYLYSGYNKTPFNYGIGTVQSTYSTQEARVSLSYKF